MESSRDEAGGKGLTALIDKEQLAYKLQLRLGDVVAHSKQIGFPGPVAYFRGRSLWDEASVDRWLVEHPQQ
jgi:hypothetical protein